jgi:histidinol-phosphate aminotransferase
VSDDKLIDLVQPHLLDAPPYVPVQPPEALAKKLGLPVERIIKLDANENQYGPSPRALEALARARNYHIYPDPAQVALRKALGDYVGFDPSWIVVGAGSDELIELCVRMFVPPGGAILNFPPTFGMYTFLADVLAGKQSTISVPRRDNFSIYIDAAIAAAGRANLIFAVSPNNPTGTPLTRRELDAMLSTGKPVVVDEAYAEFAGESYVDLVKTHPKLIVIRTLSKWAGLAGLRVGYMICDPAIAEVAMRIKQPYSVNVAAETGALTSLADLSLLQQRVGLIRQERERFAGLLNTLPGFDVTPSRANFLLCRLEGVDAKTVHAKLTARGIMVRQYDSSLLENHLRISVGRPEQDDTVIAALKEILGELGVTVPVHASPGS